MKHPVTFLATVLAGLLLVGCGSVPERQLSTVAPTYAMLPNGHDPLNPDRLSPNYERLVADGERNNTRKLERIKGRPLKFLSISGGGQNGAFGAGFLTG